MGWPRFLGCAYAVHDAWRAALWEARRQCLEGTVVLGVARSQKNSVDEGIWALPVRKRVDELALLARRLLGEGITQTHVRVDREQISVRVQVSKGAKGRISEGNYRLCVLLFEEGIDAVLVREYAKGTHAVMRFEGTVTRAKKARESAARRKRRRAVAVSSGFAVLAYVTCRACEAVAARVSGYLAV